MSTVDSTFTPEVAANAAWDFLPKSVSPEFAVPTSSPAASAVSNSADRATAFQSRLLCISLAIVYIWFGILKPLGLSPASDLVARTVTVFAPDFFVPFLGWWEVAIGVGLLFRRTLGIALGLMALQMLGTLTPFVVLPDVCFSQFPFVLSLEGQYIVKNVVLISAGIVIAMNTFGQESAPSPTRAYSTTSSTRPQ